MAEGVSEIQRRLVLLVLQKHAGALDAEQRRGLKVPFAGREVKRGVAVAVHFVDISVSLTKSKHNGHVTLSARANQWRAAHILARVDRGLQPQQLGHILGLVVAARQRKSSLAFVVTCLKVRAELVQQRDGRNLAKPTRLPKRSVAKVAARLDVSAALVQQLHGLELACTSHPCLWGVAVVVTRLDDHAAVKLQDEKRSE